MLQIVNTCDWCEKPLYPGREICKACQKKYDEGKLIKDGYKSKKQNKQ